MSRTERCPQCGVLVDRYVNRKSCWHCHEEVFEEREAMPDGGKSIELHPNDPLSGVPLLLRERLDESEHWEALQESETALSEAFATANGYPFDTAAQKQLSDARKHLREATELYRAHVARQLISDIEQLSIDEEAD